MRFHRPLDRILGTRLKTAVLRYLIRSNLELSGRQIARAVGASPKPLNRALAQLVGEGVVLQRSVGRVHLYRVNHDNPLVSNLLVRLFQQEANLLQDALRTTLGDIPGLLSASVYGSVAWQMEEPYSDVDLLVVARDKAAAEALLEERAVAFVKRYGNPLSYTVLGLEEFRERYRSHDEFLREAMDRGQVVLGKSALELTYDAA